MYAGGRTDEKAEPGLFALPHGSAGPGPIPVHHSAAAFTITSPGGPNPSTPFKYIGMWLNFTGA